MVHTATTKRKSDKCNTKGEEVMTYTSVKVIVTVTQEEREEEEHEDTQEEDQVDRNR